MGLGVFFYNGYPIIKKISLEEWIIISIFAT